MGVEESVELARKEAELTQALLMARKIYQLFNPKRGFIALFPKDTLDKALDSILTLAQNVLFDNEQYRIEIAELREKVLALLRERNNLLRENRYLKAQIVALDKDFRRMRKRFR